ncbi:protein phosphatase 2C domain-containing protein [Myxococcus sp. K15C18031901]|uniref:protein phosphatase 2C domain-containing protein n=1 Tax=Myxococcus dinghuensis TaxID=2906761 RepID=UPI0020A6E899|nr:protein phosphatase 2C domain-containing protein [Myxococcus dinghuensis]MCP3102377.1 protein phosphatase 2C domain-containing protein [Myxococcus dinghuensis]
MRIESDVLWVQKAGNAPSENEDAHACSGVIPSGGTPLHAAVADGATESLFSGPWARSLAQAYVQGLLQDARALLEVLPGLRRAWHEDVGARELPWYAREKAHQGAFATLLGVSVVGSTWTALAVGDSCLFHVRGDVLLRAFPVETSEALGTNPYLVSTHAARNAGLEERAVSATGNLQPGDSLLLMTDALACWFLLEHEAGRQPWRRLPPPGAAARHDAFVEELRGAGRLRNDDVTLLRLTVGA